MKLHVSCAVACVVVLMCAVTTVQADIVLFATDVKPGQRTLLQVDPVTGAGTVVGDTGAEIAGLTYDGVHNVLYGCSTSALYTINPSTGAATEVGSFGMELMHAIEYDPVHGILYGITSERTPYQLCTINTSTGAATGIATISVNGLTGMAFDAANGTMYASNIYSQGLVTVDLDTGAVTPVGSFNAGVQIGTGLAYSPVYGLMAADNRSNSLVQDDLYQINMATGQATLVGEIHSVGNVLSLAFLTSGTDETSVPEPLSCMLFGGSVLLGLGRLRRRLR